MNDIHRTLGEHTAQLAGLKESVEKIDANVTLLVAERHERVGSRRLFYTIAGGIGAVAGTVSSALGSIFK